MATKGEFEGKPAYIEDDKLVLQLDDETGSWLVYHKRTGWLMMGPGVIFKQKKNAVAYAKRLIDSMEMEFDNKEQMFKLNGGKKAVMDIRTQAWVETQT